MKHFDDQLTETQADHFGRTSAVLLQKGAQSLPMGIKERLHAARMKALSVKKAEKIRLPLAVLVFGLIGIAHWQDESRINDIAEVDAALLSDDVPPDAYADSGFLAFLKNGPLSDSSDEASESDQIK